MQRRIKGMFLVLLSACVLMALPAAAESGGVTLPEDLRVIEAEAFTGLQAENVTLPEGSWSLTELGAGKYTPSRILVTQQSASGTKTVLADYSAANLKHSVSAPDRFQTPAFRTTELAKGGKLLIEIWHERPEITSGEATGKSEDVLKRLSSYYASQHSLKEKIRSTIVYPLAMIVLIIIVLFLMLKMVLPVNLS